jgi:hypothetical protein
MVHKRKRQQRFLRFNQFKIAPLKPFKPGFWGFFIVFDIFTSNQITSLCTGLNLIFNNETFTPRVGNNDQKKIVSVEIILLNANSLFKNKPIGCSKVTRSTPFDDPNGFSYYIIYRYRYTHIILAYNIVVYV